MTLEQAIQSIQSGDVTTGRRLLGQLLRADPGNTEAWLWMSEVVDSQEHKHDCLLRALATDPENKRARAKLAELWGEQLAPPETHAFAGPSAVETAAIPTMAATVTDDKPEHTPSNTIRSVSNLVDAEQEEKRKRGYRNIMLAAMMVLSAACGIVLLVITLTVIKPRGEERLKPTLEPVLYEATLWCLPCEQNNNPVILWEKVGDGISRGTKVGELFHNTTISILVETWSEPEERTYFKIAAEGQQGWVPETFVKK